MQLSTDEGPGLGVSALGGSDADRARPRCALPKPFSSASQHSDHSEAWAFRVPATRKNFLRRSSDSAGKRWPGQGSSLDCEISQPSPSKPVGASQNPLLATQNRLGHRLQLAASFLYKTSVKTNVMKNTPCKL